MERSDTKSVFSAKILDQSERLIAQRDFASAINLLEPARNVFFTSYRYHLALGESYLLSGNIQKANFHLMKCLEIAPSNEVANKHLIRCYLHEPSSHSDKLSFQEEDELLFYPSIREFDEPDSDEQNTHSSGVESLAAILRSLSKKTTGPQARTENPFDVVLFPEQKKTTQETCMDIDVIAKQLEDAQFSPLQETGSPTPVSEQRQSFSDDTTLPIPTRQLAEIFIKQGAYGKAIKVYEQLVVKEPENHDFFQILIDGLKRRRNKEK